MANSVRAEEGNKAIADATLTAYELSAAPADQPLGSLPRWRSSLGEIQRASTTLLQTNSKLNLEALQIKGEIQEEQSKVDQQRVKNAQISDEIEKLRVKADENNDAGQIARLKEILADRSRQIQQRKEELAALKARHGSIESRVALARLRVAGFEVDKKSRAVDVKFRDEAAINALRVQNDVLREKVAKGETQVTLLGEKAAELKRVDNPYVGPMREISAQNAELKARRDALQSNKNTQQAQLEQVTTGKLKLEKDRSVLRVQKLLADRAVLETQLKDNSDKLYALKNAVASDVFVVPGMSEAEMEKIQKQNAAIEDLLGDLRENVALLEYKVTTLQRYKDRNKAVSQK
jgi:hypothetical protein